MAIAIGTTRQSLATYYSTLGSWIGAATGSPGTSATPANEASGGGYARVQTTWTPSTGGVVNGSAVTITVGAATYTHVILASAATVATTNQIDNADTSDVVMSGAGTLVVTPVYTQT